MYNCHTHTKHSHDCAATPADLCEEALRQKLFGFAFTDHCDCEFSDTQDIILQFENAKKDYETALAVYGDRLRLHFGIELGDALYNPAFASAIISAFDFDVILLSVHAVRIAGLDQPFSGIDFSRLPQSDLEKYVMTYYEDLLQSVRTFDFDILAHLTVPLRYIKIKYHRSVPQKAYEPLIRDILKEVIQKDKTLEINTSALTLKNGFLMPDRETVQEYLLLGGKSLSLGSDAHTAKNLTAGFSEAVTVLKQMNVKSLCYYEQRQRVYYDI